MAYDLITFGEAMVRLSSPDHKRLEQCDTLDLRVGGAEWNVAVNAARLGLKTAWVSRLVDTWAGRLVVNKAREHGVDTSHVVWEKFDGVGHVRNGFYHLEVGAGPRASAVTYDRGHTAISLMTADMVDWKAIFSQARWLHVSGITPALSPTLAETVVAAFEAAGVVASAGKAQVGRISRGRFVVDLVVDFAAGQLGDLEAQADLDAFERLD